MFLSKHVGCHRSVSVSLCYARGPSGVAPISLVYTYHGEPFFQRQVWKLTRSLNNCFPSHTRILIYALHKDRTKRKRSVAGRQWFLDFVMKKRGIRCSVVLGSKVTAAVSWSNLSILHSLKCMASMMSKLQLFIPCMHHFQVMRECALPA